MFPALGKNIVCHIKNKIQFSYDKEEVNLPVKFIGLGEGVNDLKPFDIEEYIYGLFKDM